MTGAATNRAGLVIVTVVALGLVGCARAGGDAFQSTVTDAVRVDEGLGQTFTPGADAVAGVDLLTATYGEAPGPDGELRVSVVDRAGGEVVATTAVSGDAMGDNEWVPVRFDEPAPAPEEAALRFEWTGDSPVGLWANVPPPDVDPAQRLVNDPYAGGQLLRGNDPAAGDLAFRVLGETGPAEPVRAWARLAGGAALSLAATPAFATLWALALLAALALAVIGFRTWRR